MVIKKLLGSVILTLAFSVSGMVSAAESTSEAAAIWVSENIIVLPDEERFKKEKFLACGSKKNQLKEAGMVAANDPVSQKYPYLKGYQKYLINNGKNFIKCASAINTDNGKLTGIQHYGVLDELYTYNGSDLGITFDRSGLPSLKLWAPTAHSVKIHLFNNSADKKADSVYALKEGEKGVWSIKGDTSWKNKFYLYEITVHSLYTGKTVINLVTDPYSVSLAVNSKKSQITDLTDSSLKPPGWDKLVKPELKKPEDISIYELHVRDFSSYDNTVKKENVGKYLAFTEQNTNGIYHLKNLARAGLSHIHLLPVFDIGTIEENPSLRQDAVIPAGLPPESEAQQKIISAVKDKDSYNWGYDPYHYSVPEGSYAVNPDGSSRILEFRKMVKSLNELGLRVVMDVVFNHTHTYGQAEKSVLDKIVPGYYYRLDKNGRIQQSTCCPDTATERKMMEKLMADSLVLWAKYYKIDGFRFDLMGHHTRGNMHVIRERLNQLTVSKDGVNGGKIYLYGEGWKFGSLDAILPEEGFNQQNAYGYGIGSFNDRVRDSARGGNFSHSSKSDQGFISGLYYDYNKTPENTETPAEPEKQKVMLLNYMDNIRIGLAGNLKNYSFTGSSGKHLKGSEINYRGNPGSGYTADPEEVINYISIHDNYTLWDQLTAKAPFNTEGRNPATATTEEKVRMHNLGLSLIALAQGIPIFDAGSDMIRSKSGDGDSYNSGDWFNRLDFTYQSNNWGVGLPPAERNLHEWEFWKKRLADTSLIPDSENILAAVTHFQKLLRIRYDSELFRLETAEEIIKRVSFLNAEGGARQIPGLIVMSISDDGKNLDPKKKRVMVLFNANDETVRFSHKSLKGLPLMLHPELLKEGIVSTLNGLKVVPADNYLKEASFNHQTGTFTIPPRTTAVYYQPE